MQTGPARSPYKNTLIFQLPNSIPTRPAVTIQQSDTPALGSGPLPWPQRRGAPAGAAPGAPAPAAALLAASAACRALAGATPGQLRPQAGPAAAAAAPEQGEQGRAGSRHQPKPLLHLLLPAQAPASLPHLQVNARAQPQAVQAGLPVLHRPLLGLPLAGRHQVAPLPPWLHRVAHPPQQRQVRPRCQRHGRRAAGGRRPAAPDGPGSGAAARAGRGCAAPASAPATPRPAALPSRHSAVARAHAPRLIRRNRQHQRPPTGLWHPYPAAAAATHTRHLSIHLELQGLMSSSGP